METGRRWFEENKKWLYMALGFVFFWGLLAHAYCFFDNSVSHDSLNEFHAAVFGNDWKIQLGRVFTPIYRDLFRSDATLPWLIGALSLLWIGLAVFFVVRLFDMDSAVMVFLTAGVMATNVSVSSTAATYINDLDGNMFALMCAAAAVYCWKTLPWGEVLGAVLIMGSLGIYQGYLTVTITLVMMVCILRLFRGDAFRTVFRKGLRAIGMILAGGILYYIAMKAMTALSGNALTTGDYNSLGKALELTPQNLVEYVAGAYRDWFSWLWNAYSSYPAVMVRGITVLLAAAAVLAVGIWLLNRRIGLWEKLLGLTLMGLLPLGMNIFYVLTLDNNHDLMVFAIWLSYLLVLLLVQWLAAQWQGMPRREKLSRCIRIVCFLLVFLVAYGSVQFANGMYLKKDLEFDAYLSLMTRIAARMESYEGYVPGETPVVFVGLPQMFNDMIPGFREYWNVIGMQFSDVITQPSRPRFQAYFDYILSTPLLTAEPHVWAGMLGNQQVKQMPAYPDAGCLAMMDGVLIVKLGNAPV
ncbi:MAG: glucosyltransferase domain-containing protein [Oscillospiraceae bacterium]|nr:glucosyltransferase domain-containing protein [Oscillospiraceae bacterium]